MREPDHNSLDIISVEPTKSGWFKKVILILFGIVLSFIILEVGLRCLGFAAYEMKETDAGTGLRVFKASSSIPYRSICFSNTIKTNSLGFHSREYSREKPPNVRRIIVVGDSFVESAQVSLEKSFFSLLEHRLNETAPVGVVYEVIPFGIGGNGTLANLQYLVAYGLNFQPDLVIDAFNTSDLDNDAFTTNLDAKIEALRNQTAHSGGDGSLPFKDRLKFWTKKVLKHSIVAVTVYSKYLSFKSWGNEQESLSEGAPLVEQKFSATSTKEIERAWENQSKILAAMQGFSEQAGARFLLVSMADAMRLHPARDYFISQFSKPEDVVIDLPEKKLDDIMAQLGGRHYAMLGDLQEKAVSSGSEELKWTCDAHYNEIGHEWAADAILKFLKNHPELIE